MRAEVFMWWMLTTLLSAQAAPPVLDHGPPLPGDASQHVDATVPQRVVFKGMTGFASAPTPEVTVLISRMAPQVGRTALPAAPQLGAHIQRDIAELP